jgi:hypothetical protein
MNIFVTSPDPRECAIVLADDHVKKMAVESCQMLALVASPWYHGYGTLPKVDGTPYRTQRGAHRNHPCTVWAAQSVHNAMWLIHHGLWLCHEFRVRYGKKHGCFRTLEIACDIFPLGSYHEATNFVRAMPDEFKLDTTIDTYTAYKRYLNTKVWVKDDYIRKPERKPNWID